MKKTGIGLLGFGTIGAGVVKGLQKNHNIITDKLGIDLELRKIADLDIESDRGVNVDPSILTKNAEDVIDNPDIDIIIELIGGTSIAKNMVIKAINKGKPVVTANKALLAEHGKEIFELAEEKNTDIYFGASVGGGIPIIRALREGLLANQIQNIYGILNGTCNYILTRMEKGKVPFNIALKEAQAEGYAEADPGLDIDGIDTAHKAVILASLAYGNIIPMNAVSIEGIHELSEIDIQYALDLGYRIKLLAIIKYNPAVNSKSPDINIEIRVHPALVPTNHMLASVSGVFNAIMIRGNMTGDTLYYGRGAGQDPTASTIIGDTADAARNLIGNHPKRVSAIPLSGSSVKIIDQGEITTRYYIRLSVLDKSGVLASISSVLGKHNISIASVLQKEGRSGKHVPIVIVTHSQKESNFTNAINEIDAMDIIGYKAVRIRIEDWDQDESM